MLFYSVEKNVNSSQREENTSKIIYQHFVPILLVNPFLGRNLCWRFALLNVYIEFRFVFIDIIDVFVIRMIVFNAPYSFGNIHLRREYSTRRVLKTITKNVKEKIYLSKNNNGFVLVKCFLRLCDVVVLNVAKQSDRYIVNGFFPDIHI